MISTKTINNTGLYGALFPLERVDKVEAGEHKKYV